MPLYYDCAHKDRTTSGSANTEVCHLFGTATATVGFYLQALKVEAKNNSTAGSGALRIYTNAATADSGGQAFTPNPRGMLTPAAATTWKDDAFAITAGAGTMRGSVGFAQTGGGNDWFPLTPDMAIGVKPGTTNQLDLRSLTISTGVTFDMEPIFSEGP